MCAPSPPVAPRPAASESPAIRPVATKPDAAAATASAIDRAERDKRQFIADCAENAHAIEYCECAWDQVRSVTDEEHATDELTGPEAERLKSLLLVCISKHPEGPIAEAFSRSCIGKKPELKDFCDCQWVELRKRFPAAAFTDQRTVDSAPYQAARREIMKPCGALLPESASKDAFMEACLTHPSYERYCDCAWTELHKIASTAELNAEKFDKRRASANVASACGPLRPSTTRPAP